MIRQPVDVIVRTFNSETTVRAALESIRSQSLPTRIVVVDSGSSDATLEICRRFSDTIIRMPHENFSFGRSLNMGVQLARSSVVFALSSHTRAPDRHWVERSLAHYSDSRVIATTGAFKDYQGHPLMLPIKQDYELASRFPRWGFSNTACSWRVDVLRQHPFDELLPACEDKEWALRALRDGGVAVMDPQLAVHGTHRRKQGWRRYFDRLRRENAAFFLMGADAPSSRMQLVSAWFYSAINAEPGTRKFSSLTRALHFVSLHFAAVDVSRNKFSMERSPPL